MNRTKSHITVTLEVEVEVTAEFYSGFAGSRLEPPEPASFDYIESQMVKTLDAYCDDNWEYIEGELMKEMADAAEDYDGA